MKITYLGLIATLGLISCGNTATISEPVEQELISVSQSNFVEYTHMSGAVIPYYTSSQYTLTGQNLTYSVIENSSDDVLITKEVTITDDEFTSFLSAANTLWSFTGDLILIDGCIGSFIDRTIEIQGDEPNTISEFYCDDSDAESILVDFDDTFSAIISNYSDSFSTIECQEVTEDDSYEMECFDTASSIEEI